MKKSDLKIIFLLFIYIILFLFSFYYVLNWFKDSNSIAKESENILNLIDSSLNENLTDNTTNENTINSNFSELEQVNTDVVGWIKVNGTEIDYPFVQTSDNSYYLTHSFSKEYNKSGWIFLDYRNNINELSQNTIIYGHSRYDSSMFGSLRNSLKNNWLENEENHKIYISTKYKNTEWQVFSVYHLPNTNDYLATSFANNDEYKNFIDLIKKRSVYDFNIEVTEDDKILTLSTCFRTNERMVMHGKLISSN